MSKIWAVLLGWVSCGAFVNAATPPVAPIDITDQRAPGFTVYGSQEGLSNEIWSTIGFDRDGYVWAGSASQLARFDGYRWRLWPLAEARSLVRDSYSAPGGNLWVVFEREGLAGYDGEHWRLSDQPGVIHRFSQTRAGDGGEVGWIAHDHGFSKLQQGQWVSDPGNRSWPAARAVAIAQSQTLGGRPSQWASAIGHGLFRRWAQPDGSWGPWLVHEIEGFEARYVSDLIVTEDQGREELWILTYGAGVARVRQNDIRVWRAANGELPSEAIYSAVATHNQAGERLLWVASRAGLLRFRGEGISVYDRRHGLPSDAIRGIKLQRGVDGLDLLWIATENGVARAALTESQWQTVSLTGARENGVFGLLLEPDGNGGERLWLGTQQRGLHLLHQGRWRRFQAADGSLPAEGVRGIWLLPNGHGGGWRLAGLHGGELLQISDDLRFSLLPTPWEKGAQEAVTEAIARQIDGSSEYWFGLLQGGSYCYCEERWQQFLPQSSSQPWAVHKLLDQVDGQQRHWLWAATDRGLARRDTGAWELLGTQLRLPEDSYRSLTLVPRAGRSELWIGTGRHGVLRLDVSDPEQPRLLDDDAIPPPPDPTVYSVLTDSQQRLYLCTNNGAQQLAPNSAGGYSSRVYSRVDGMVHDECNTNSQFVDSSDRYWVGTLGGLSLFDPNLAISARPTVPKALRFTELRLDGQSVALDQATLQLPPGTRELRISFTLQSQMRERESTYRSQLVGFEPEFGEWTSERSRAFSGLPPGQYQFLLEGRDYAGTTSDRQRLVLVIEPRWWQHTATQLVLAALTLILVSLLVMIYNRGLRHRQRQLKRLVAARTADLNEANQKLVALSYADPLTGLANRRRLKDAMDSAIARARTLSMPVGVIVLDVDHFKPYNDHHGHLAGDAALRAVAQALSTATREQDLVARFGGEEFACLLTDADRQTVIEVADRMRALVEALPPRALGNDTDTITISAGALSRIPDADDDAESLLNAADAALYRAKDEGRNRVRFAES